MRDEWEVDENESIQDLFDDFFDEKSRDLASGKHIILIYYRKKVIID